MHLGADNSNLLADVNVKCPIDLYNVNALGTNSTGGTIKVLPNGQISSYRWETAASLTFTRDFTFLGGAAGGRTHNSRVINYAGQFNLQADTAFITSTASFETGEWRSAARSPRTPRRASSTTRPAARARPAAIST